MTTATILARLTMSSRKLRYLSPRVWPACAGAFSLGLTDLILRFRVYVYSKNESMLLLFVGICQDIFFRLGWGLIFRQTLTLVTLLRGRGRRFLRRSAHF